MVDNLIRLGVARHSAKAASFRNSGHISKVKTSRKNKAYDKFVKAFKEKMGVDDENLHQYIPHILGVMGEYAYSEYAMLELDRQIYNIRDDGADFPGNIEVKTSTFAHGTELKITHKELKQRGVKDLYVLCFISEDDPFTVIVLGSITGEEFMEKKREKQYAGGPLNWVVSLDDMQSINYEILLT